MSASDERRVPLPPHYAESVAVSALTPDASAEVSFRLARFPGQGEGAVWMSVFVDGRPYAAVDPHIALGPACEATALQAEQAVFAVANSERIAVTTTRRHDAGMRAEVGARTLAHHGLHPPSGHGTVPVELDVSFRATHGPVRVRPGRVEVLGSATARVSTPEGDFTVEGPGKWHEQSGARASFAPSFTYLWGAAADCGLLARGGSGTAWGFVLEGGRVTPVDRLTIDPLGTPVRRFEIGLGDGRVVPGTARMVRESSVPIEGGRRPSATVRIESPLGTMVGHLNDWKPEP